MFTGFLIAAFLVVVVVVLSVVSRKSDSPTVTVHADDKPLSVSRPFRMTYHKRDTGRKRWEVRTADGVRMHTFDVPPTEDVVIAAGFAVDSPIATAAADYRKRVNDRCSDKGKRLRYDD